MRWTPGTTGPNTKRKRYENNRAYYAERWLVYKPITNQFRVNSDILVSGTVPERCVNDVSLIFPSFNSPNWRHPSVTAGPPHLGLLNVRYRLDQTHVAPKICEGSNIHVVFWRYILNFSTCVLLNPYHAMRFLFVFRQMYFLFVF